MTNDHARMDPPLAMQYFAFAKMYIFSTIIMFIVKDYLLNVPFSDADQSNVSLITPKFLVVRFVCFMAK